MVNRVVEYLRRSLVTGTAIVLPVLVTGFVFYLIVDLLSGLLDPLAVPIQMSRGDDSPVASQLITVVILFGTIFMMGAFTESRVGGNRLKEGLDTNMARIPGIRSIYGPLDQISTMLLEGDTNNFKDVVLVEFPKEGSYSIAFQTSHPPDMIERATEEEDMLTVFMPMGPNPFMGGFVLTSPRTMSTSWTCRSKRGSRRSSPSASQWRSTNILRTSPSIWTISNDSITRVGSGECVLRDVPC